MTTAPRLPVLLTTLDFPPTHGGIQTMATQIIANASSVSFRVVAPADRGWEAYDATSGIPTRRVRTVGPGRRGYVPGVTVGATAISRRNRPAVVLAMHTMAAGGGLLARTPTVVVCHGGELRSARIRRVAALVLPRARRIIANSRFTRTFAVALGADPLRTVVIPVGAPTPQPVLPEQIEATKQRYGRYVLSVARLEPHKGHDRLIEALKDVPDARLVIVGDGSARLALEAQVRDAGLTERVSFTGAVPDDALPALFAGAAGFALATRMTAGPRSGVEGGGIALLEACAYGLPVVASNTGGIPETIVNGETGLLVDPDDVASIARALKRILTDDRLATSLAEGARALALGERSWASIAARFEDVLHEAAAR